MAVCSVCQHPRHEELDALLLDEDVSLQDIVMWQVRECPDVPAIPIYTLSKHRTNHLRPSQLAELEVDGEENGLVLRDGQLYDRDGRAIERVAAIDALNTIITIGLKNALANPKSIEPRHLLEAVKTLKSIGEASGETAEFLKAWAQTVKRTRRRRKPIDVTPADTTPAPDTVAQEEDELATTFAALTSGWDEDETDDA